MTVYADFSYYNDEYLAGKSAAVKDADFTYYARQASSIIDRYTFGNVPADVPEEVRLCCCELTELLQAEKAAQVKAGGGKTSESVQGWSVAYESAEARQRAAESAQRECVYRWLGNTGLLFSGVM